MIKKSNIKKQHIFQLIAGILIIVSVNIIGNFLFFRLDRTSEKRFSLSDVTKTMLKNLDDYVFIKVYLEGEFPIAFKKLRNETREMLDEFRAYSPLIEYEFIDPTANPDKKIQRDFFRQLIEKGLEPTNILIKDGSSSTQKVIFPGAIATYKGRDVSIPLLTSQVGMNSQDVLNQSIQDLEYEFCNAIRKLSRPYRPKIGFLEGHGELSNAELSDIMKSLSEYYDVERIRIDGKLKALADFNALIIAKPDSIFPEKDKFVIDQFIMRGGKTLWFVDPVFAEIDCLRVSNQTLGIARNLNLEDMPFFYGARLNNNLLQDLQAISIPAPVGNMGGRPQLGLLPWFYNPLVSPALNHPITKNINYIKTEFISSIDTIEVPRVKKTLLLRTSKNTRIVNTPALINLDILYKKPNETLFNKPYQSVAVLLEGNFHSVFDNRIPDTLLKNQDLGFIAESKHNKMLVVSDGDMIKNQLKQQNEPLPLGFDKYTGETFGNKNFVLNAVNYVCDDSTLINLRVRDVAIRLLDSVQVNKKRTMIQMINLLLPVAIIIILGIAFSFYRRKKFRKQIK